MKMRKKKGTEKLEAVAAEVASSEVLILHSMETAAVEVMVNVVLVLMVAWALVKVLERKHLCRQNDLLCVF